MAYGHKQILRTGLQTLRYSVLMFEHLDNLEITWLGSAAWLYPFLPFAPSCRLELRLAAVVVFFPSFSFCFAFFSLPLV